QAQERDMFPEACATGEDPEWQAEYRVYEQHRICPVHALTSRGPTYACAIWTSISSGAVLRVSWVHCRSRSRIRFRYSLRVMRLPMVVSWRMESTMVRKCSPPPRSMKGVRMRMALSDSVFNHRYPSRSGR